ncbi:MAG: GNAT family N-acetyltransferase [Bdellovibrionota bacterium]
MITRFLTTEDASKVLDLYRLIAVKPDAGFVRMEDEINHDYVTKSLGRGVSGGVAIGAFDRTNQKIVGAITARKLGLKLFDHVLSGLVIGVHPDHRRQGIGRRLFLDFLEHIHTERPDILRVELIARDSYQRQIEFYESVGFRREGTFEKRIRRADGTFEADVPMGWIKPEL